MGKGRQVGEGLFVRGEGRDDGDVEALIEEDAPSAAAAGIVKKAEEPGEFFEGEGATMGVPGVAKGRC